MEETQAAPPTADLESRIAYLEAQNEGLKRVGALALVLILIVGGLFVFQVWTDLKGIATGGIVFHDDNKNGRLALTVSPQGSLAIVPINQLGGAPSLKPAQGDYSGLGIYDSQGKLRIIMGITPEDQPIMGIIGEDGQIKWSPVSSRPAPAGSATPAPVKSATPAPQSATPTPAATSSPAH